MRRLLPRDVRRLTVALEKQLPGGDDADQGPTIALDVHRIRWRDLLSVRSIRDRNHFNHPYMQPDSGNPFTSGLRQLLSIFGTTQRVIVATVPAGVVGYAVFDVVGAEKRWNLESLGANLGVYQAEPVYEELLSKAVVDAGLSGTKRLYARIPAGDPMIRVARRTGFTPYAQEHVLVSNMAPHVRPLRSARRQTDADIWSIHQLYMSSVPRAVQTAEALTSHYWERNRRPTGCLEANGWVFEDGYQAIAYARVVSHPSAHIIEFLIHDEYRSWFPDLISTACMAISSQFPRRVYILVRGYQSEYLNQLEGMGFASLLRQDLHLKYTVAPVRVPAPTYRHQGVEIKEPVGKQVPTFLKGSDAGPTSERAS